MTKRPPLERMIALARMLRSGKPFNCRSAAQALEIDAKTIGRDLEFLRDRLRYDFEYDGSRRTYRLRSAPDPSL